MFVVFLSFFCTVHTLCYNSFINRAVADIDVWPTVLNSSSFILGASS
jgi:hypothetical protein